MNELVHKIFSKPIQGKEIVAEKVHNGISLGVDGRSVAVITEEEGRISFTVFTDSDNPDMDIDISEMV